MRHIDGEVALNPASHCASAALPIVVGDPVQTCIPDRLLIVLVNEVLRWLHVIA